MQPPMEYQALGCHLPYWNNFKYSYCFVNPCTQALDLRQEPPQSLLHIATPSISPEASEKSSLSPGSVRPFKAMSKLSTPYYDNFHSHAAYQAFRERMLAKFPTSSDVNTNMRRSQNGIQKSNDPEYLEKRKKNNDAARRSRLARRAKEDEIAIRCAFLEEENRELKIRLAAAESEKRMLHSLLNYPV